MAPVRRAAKREASCLASQMATDPREPEQDPGRFRSRPSSARPALSNHPQNPRWKATGQPTRLSGVVKSDAPVPLSLYPL